LTDKAATGIARFEGSSNPYIKLTEGVEKALLSDLLPSKKRGMGYWAFQMTLAIVAIPANVMTGVIASVY
jgi:hypothetical protein